MKYNNVVLRRTKMMRLERKIAKILREVKLEKRTITYEELGSRTELIPRHRSMAYALGNLVWEDLRRGRPIRSSLVVRKNSDGIPAPRYFEYLRELGFEIPPGTEEAFVKVRQLEVFAA